MSPAGAGEEVLHVSDTYLPTLGGIELHLGDLVARQRARGVRARVVTATPAARTGSGTEPDPAWVERTGEPGRAAPRARSEARLDRSLDDLARRHASGASVCVHVHLSVVSPLGTHAVGAAARRGLPTLVTVHSMLDGLGPLPDLAVAGLGLRRHRVVWSAVSARAAEPLRRVLGGGAVVRVLPNAVDPGDWSSDDLAVVPPVPPGVPSRADVPTVLSVMRLTRVKRSVPLGHILVGALGAVPQARAVVVGDGPRRAALERVLRRGGVADRVALVGGADRSRVRAELVGATCFLAPAEKESFGIAALEARTCNVPVVAHALSGVTEFVSHGREGLLGRDDDELRDHVVRLLTDPALHAEIVAHDRSTPSTHDWTAALDRAADLYAEARALAVVTVAEPAVRLVR